jgi:hypothetical protein
MRSHIHEIHRFSTYLQQSDVKIIGDRFPQFKGDLLVTADARLQEKVSNFQVTDYHLHALRLTIIRIGPAAVTRYLVAAYFNMFILQGELSWPKDNSVKPKKQRNPRSNPRLPRLQAQSTAITKRSDG